jgi:hypothetical protein
MATGSGAFLVQACRYLSERLMEAWEEAERAGFGKQAPMNFEKPDQAPPKSLPRITPFGDVARGRLDEQIIPEGAGDRVVYARRLVAQRCLYGVDKNLMAVEMAKLSLWLLTLAKGQPFTFLDHAIRRGDSLVGIHDLEQLRRLHFDLKSESQYLLPCDMRAMVNEAVALRLRIEEMRADDIEDVQAQERLLHEAEEKMARLRYAADILTAAELKPATAGERVGLRDDAAIRIGCFVSDGTLDEFRQAARKDLGGQTPFHWPLAFPEVFSRRGGFDAFVGNPPFMGGQKITGTVGEPYREYVVNWLANGQRGSADLCSYFFLRATKLLRPNGMFGLLATNTIAQGDTREVGLDQLTAGGVVLPRAVPSRKWPGLATVEVAHVWGRRGSWASSFVLDDKPVNGITPFLTAPGVVIGNPHRLKANEGKSFQGCIVLGIGFVLTPEETQALIAKDSRNKDVLFPYLNGEDFNSRPDQSPSRWVINFFDWPEEKAREYPDCFKIVEEKVKPTRLLDNRKVYREYWWQYAEKRPALSQAIAGMKRVLMRARVANLNSWDFTTARIVNSEQTVILAEDTFAWFALMQNSMQTAWIEGYASSMRTDVRYTPSDCFETFPFPAASLLLEQIGERYHADRREVMLARRQGLTKTYNRFHDAEETDADIAKLRQLHVEMDQAVVAAYGWTGLDLGHGFHETRQGVRYTISEPARREVLARLLKLNHERYAAEVAQGLHEKKKSGTAKGRKKQQAKGLFE